MATMPSQEQRCSSAKNKDAGELFTASGLVSEARSTRRRRFTDVAVKAELLSDYEREGFEQELA
jgi:hypothetical protein